MTVPGSHEETIVAINRFLVDEFEVDPKAILPGADLRETLQLDSLDYVDLVVVIENNFGIKINPPDFATILTFQHFYDYIFQKMDEKKPA
jgi:acyl carrier protein